MSGRRTLFTFQLFIASQFGLASPVCPPQGLVLHPCTDTNSGPLTFTPRNCTALPEPSTSCLPETLIVNAEPDAELPDPAVSGGGAGSAGGGGVGLTVLPEPSDGGDVVPPDWGGAVASPGDAGGAIVPPADSVGVVPDETPLPVVSPAPEEPDPPVLGAATALSPDTVDPLEPEEALPVDDPPPHAASESKRIPAAA